MTANAYSRPDGEVRVVARVPAAGTLRAAARAAQRVRDGQHGPERVGVRAHMAGQAYLVRRVQQRHGLGPIDRSISLARRGSHAGEYPAP